MEALRSIHDAPDSKGIPHTQLIDLVNGHKIDELIKHDYHRFLKLHRDFEPHNYLKLLAFAMSYSSGESERVIRNKARKKSVVLCEEEIISSLTTSFLIETNDARGLSMHREFTLENLQKLFSYALLKKKPIMLELIFSESIKYDAPIDLIPFLKEKRMSETDFELFMPLIKHDKAQLINLYDLVITNNYDELFYILYERYPDKSKLKVFIKNLSFCQKLSLCHSPIAGGFRDAMAFVFIIMLVAGFVVFVYGAAVQNVIIFMCGFFSMPISVLICCPFWSCHR